MKGNEMLGPRQLQLVEVLESGKYSQCKGVLQDSNSYCCLGVASVLAKQNGVPVDEVDGYLTGNMLNSEIVDYYHFNSCNGEAKNREYLSCLWELNDSKGKTFKEIAQVLRDNPEEYFQNPV